MSLKIDRVQLEIIVQQDSARKKIMDLEKSMKKANSELDRIKKQFGENSREYKAQETLIMRLKQEYDDLFDKIGVGNLSLRELGNRQRELNAIIRNLDPNLPEWKRYNEQLKEVNNRIKQLKNEARDTDFSLSKVADWVNQYGGMLATAAASLAGLTITMRDCVDEYAQMEEAESQVIKYTGMTTGEVKKLNETFKNMDARTPREELNRLAGEAGKLGVAGVQEVKEFVDAANMINVALGEDLGEDAVNQIGKLSQMFGDSGRSLKENMIAVGSAVNQVAQSTSASEPYLVEFTARMGGVGKQARMSITDIMGFASALDQNMLRSEMSSTALSGVIMRVFQEPEKYAKLAGMEVEKFKEMVKKDVNEAVLEFLSALSRMGGMSQMAPILKEMQLSGAEAASVITTLAGNVDMVRREQENANRAFQEGTSIIGEYNVQNNTVQAQLDKMQAKFKNVKVELGEQLLPVMRYMISTGSLTVKGLKWIVDVLMKYKGTVLTLSTAIASYVVTVKLATLWEEKFKNAQLGSMAVSKLSTAAYNAKRVSVLALGAAKALLVGKLNQAKVAWRGLNLVMKSNPIGLAISLVATLVVGFTSLVKSTNKATSGIKKMYAEIDKETSELDRLFNSLKNTSEGTQRRKELIEEINKKYGEYLPNLLQEKSSLDEIKEAYDKINTAITANIALKARDDEKTTATEESAQKQMERLGSLREEYIELMGSDEGSADFIRYVRQMAQETAETSDNFNRSVSRVYATLEKNYTGGKKLTSGMRSDIANFMNDMLRLDRELDEIDKKYEGWTNKKQTNVLPEVEFVATRETNTPSLGGDEENTLEQLEKKFKLELEAKKAAAKQEKLIRMMAGEDEKNIAAKYNAEIYQAEMEYLLKRKAALEVYKEDVSDIQSQIYDRMISEAERLKQEEADQKKQNQNKTLEELDTQEEEEKRKAKQAFIAGDLADEETYQKALLEIARKYLQKRKDLMASFGMDTTAVDGKLLDMDFAGKKSEEKEEAKSKQDRKEEGLKQIDNTASFAEKFNLLDQMYEQDLLTFEEYQQKKTEIEQQQAEQRKQIAEAAFSTVGQAASAASQLVNALQDAEISKVERRYDKQIKAAKKAGKDTSKLEEEKEEAVNAVKKKYADKQFAANVLQVASSTAVAAMNAYSSLASIPIVGPALGAVAMAAAIAAGAAQLAVAKQQRDEAKGLKEGGYSQDYVEGYTRSGNPNETAGVIPVHKNEFVANHEAVANPAVKQFLDVFDLAQKRGTIRMLNTTQILEQVRTRTGRYAGGYSEENTSASRSSAQPLTGFPADQRSQVVVLLEENNRLLTLIQQKELVVDPRKVRDGIKHIDTLERNVSR